jgi:hypothetical protein
MEAYFEAMDAEGQRALTMRHASELRGKAEGVTTMIN